MVVALLRVGGWPGLRDPLRLRGYRSSPLSGTYVIAGMRPRTPGALAPSSGPTGSVATSSHDKVSPRLMKQLRERLSYANTMSTIAVFLVLSGASAFAATQLGKNSVGTKQIKNGAVSGAKIKKRTITGTNINFAKLGTVPSATNSTNASSANALAAPEAMHIVNAPGQPPFEGGSINLSLPMVSGLPPAAFYKDKEGIVHLEGIVKVGKEVIFGTLIPIFTLPPGFRPANGVLQVFPTGSPGSTGAVIAGTNSSDQGHFLSGNVLGTKESELVLSGITFRAEG